jgi:hypothetical protein
LKWTNHIKIQTGLDAHRNIIRLIGFRRATNNIYHVILELSNENLFDVIKSERFKEMESFASLFFRLSTEIITAMVRK